MYSCYEFLAYLFPCFKVDNAFVEITENLRNERIRILQNTVIEDKSSAKYS